jgi:hypothetical protein
VKSSVEVSDDGKAMKFYEVAPFALYLTPEAIAVAASTLTEDGDGPGGDAAHGAGSGKNNEGSDSAGQNMEAELR